MILIFFPDGQIHYTIPGFGKVEEKSTLFVDGNDTTTCATDVEWKYIVEQTLERNEMGGYLHTADHYEAITPPPSIEEQIATLTYLLGA